MKVLNQWTDNSVSKLLELLNDAFQEGVKLPSSYYEARKITENLGFMYKTLDACPRSCMLFRGENTKLNECAICGRSRWKKNNGNINGSKRIAARQMQCFPLKPRLQRLYMASKISKHMK